MAPAITHGNGKRGAPPLRSPSVRRGLARARGNRRHGRGEVEGPAREGSAEGPGRSSGRPHESSPGAADGGRSQP